MKPTAAMVCGVLAGLIFTGIAVAGRADTVRGEIVQVRQQTRTGNEGALTEIRVRTQERQEMWLRLGPAEEMGERFRVGDRVRARGVPAGQGSPMEVRTIRNLRSGERMQLRAEDGTLLRQRDRARDGSGAAQGSRIRARDRVHEPGTGGVTGAGRRGGGGR